MIEFVHQAAGRILVIEPEIELRQVGSASCGKNVVVDSEAGGVHRAAWLQDAGCLTEKVVELVGQHVGEDRLRKEEVDRSVRGGKPHSIRLQCAGGVVQAVDDVMPLEGEVRVMGRNVPLTPFDRFTNDVGADVATSRAQNVDQGNRISSDATSDLQHVETLRQRVLTTDIADVLFRNEFKGVRPATGLDNQVDRDVEAAKAHGVHERSPYSPMQEAPFPAVPHHRAGHPVR